MTANAQPPDLTAQFLDDFERLRRECDALRGRPPSDDDPYATSDAIRAREDEIVRLREKLAELEETIARLSRDGEAERKRLLGERDERIRDMEEAHGRAIARKVEELRRERAQFEEAGRRAADELAARIRGLEGQIEGRLADERAELARRFGARMAVARDRALAEIDGVLTGLASVPLGLRVAALIVDVLLVATLAATIRLGTAWGLSLPLGPFLVGTLALFALRTFASPGNGLLGISAWKIGPDLRPRGRVPLTARLACGLLHYGPLLATACTAVVDEPTARALGELGAWITDPAGSPRALGSILMDMLRPTAPDLPAAILILTLTWWGILLASVLSASWTHPGTPYLRNTTLVEAMWRVGFRRLTPPALALASLAPGD